MSARRPTILGIDDDDDILLYLRTVLEAESYEFVGASSAEEGLRALERVRPDLVIVDLMMEEVDSGAGFAKELRLRGLDVPVYLLSSVGDNLNLAADYAALGFSGIFQKPLSRQHLLTVIRARLGTSGEGRIGGPD
jgi:DNA-binding response OmpR family regulator